MLYPEQLTEPMTATEAKRLFGRVFGNLEGERALLYIMTKIGGVGHLRRGMDTQARLLADGKCEAALEIMNLAGFSPLHLADRLMRLPPLTPQKDPDHEISAVQDPAARGRRARRPARAAGAAPAVPASAVADAAGFGGDD